MIISLKVSVLYVSNLPVQRTDLPQTTRDSTRIFCRLELGEGVVSLVSRRHSGSGGGVLGPNLDTNPEQVPAARPDEP